MLTLPTTSSTHEGMYKGSFPLDPFELPALPIQDQYKPILVPGLGWVANPMVDADFLTDTHGSNVGDKETKEKEGKDKDRFKVTVVKDDKGIRGYDQQGKLQEPDPDDHRNYPWE